jgi:hypothetical protein
LLRADVHTLFDLYLLAIDPDDPEKYKIKLAPELCDSSYGELNDKILSLPRSKSNYPSQKALKWRWNEFLQRQK